MAAYTPFLGVFFAGRGLSGREIGVLSAIGPLMAFLLTPALTALADRRGWRVRLLCLSLAGQALSLLILPLPASFAGLLFIVTLLAAVASPVIPLADGLIIQLAAGRGLAYGKMRLWGSLSWSVVAAGGGFLWQQWGFTLMFPVACLLLLTTILIARRFAEERPVAARTRPALWTATRERRFLTVIGTTFGISLAMTMNMTFGSIYLNRLGGGQALVGLFAGVMAVSELPTMQWSERIMRRLGGPGTLALAATLLGGGYFSMALITQPTLLLSAGVLQGLGFGLFATSSVRLVADLAPPALVATYQGLLSAAVWGLAPLVGGPLGGVIFDAAGPVAVFLVAGAVTTIAGVGLLLALRGGVFRPPAATPESLTPEAVEQPSSSL
jgi:PPP family 3-phenylpropionic acid transporter